MQTILGENGPEATSQGCMEIRCDPQAYIIQNLGCGTIKDNMQIVIIVVREID